MSGIKIQKAMPIHNQTHTVDQRFKEAAQMYEKHFLGEMVKAMRKTVTKSDFTKPNMAQKIYEQKMDEKYVDAWGDQGGIGLGKMIYDQLKERFGQQMQAPPPKGPLPVNRIKSFKIDNDPTGNFKGIQIESKSENIQDQSKITNPWSGNLSKVIRSENNRQTLMVDHDNGMQSLVSFVGKMSPLKLNDKIEAGQKLGDFVGESLSVTWMLRQKAT